MIKRIMMMATILAGWALWPMYGYAKTGVDCAKVTDAGERLLCYDAVFKSETVTKNNSASNWAIVIDKSKIDDSQTVVLGSDSDEEFDDKFSLKKINATLLLRCFEGKTSILIGAGNHFLADIQSFGKVTIRLDSGAPFTQGFTSTTDHKWLGLFGGTAVPLIKKIMAANVIVLRFTPFNGAPMVATFQVAGLQNDIAPLRQACRW
ncbi:hypothetical protein Avi_6163 [Allorhizobium ampelinum S4]|uniref:Type VI secretion protein n=2 Tax=Rhizobium/Agrobacterium group TaxID=227290 RepID=B9K2Q8_ALLAM|nr:type VI secretion protein [Allorhizobium ampelinum]ACM39156.1 hypothetical protein Avi_6163 [Allorhizobium ampelinum S4]MUO30808.1 hypothetical protein [Agrobacterium vitis]